MSVIATQVLEPAWAAEQGAQIRSQLEEEYRRLRSTDRPALMAALEAAVPTSDDELLLLFNRIDVLDRRIAALRAVLAGDATSMSGCTWVSPRR